jgi:5-oxoprolinase (ATP-hydrolysing)
MSLWKLSIDTGGTFTDCLCTTPDNATRRLKILSNSTLKGKILRQSEPDSFDINVSWDLDVSILEGYEVRLWPKGRCTTIRNMTANTLKVADPVSAGSFDTFEIISPEEVPVFAARLLTSTHLHKPLPEIDVRLGTTKGTNALLEKQGAPVILLITKGFKDLLAIGNQQRPDLFTLNIHKKPLFYASVLEVTERMDASGNVLTPLTDQECQSLIEKLSHIRAGHTKDLSLSIAFLHSNKNNLHENHLKSRLKEAGYSLVSCSSELSQNSKILPRAETTVVNSYLSPVMASYFSEIENNIKGNLEVMTSAGHLTGLSRFHAKDSLLSGPAGGVKGAARIAQQADINQFVSFDMGGTSTDVSLFDKGEDYAYETMVGGAVIQAPCLAIDTIAAGGGSICYYDGHVLQAGPNSAGAKPGPACYGADGPLTITDVNLLAGRVVENSFSIPLDRNASERQLQLLLEQIKEKEAGVTKESVIKALLRITTEKMARSIRSLASKKGSDMEGFTLITFGGAGGQHACDLAEQLSINSVLVPYEAGLLSAYGISITETAHIEEKELMIQWNEVENDLEDIIKALFEKSYNKLKLEGHSHTKIYLKNTLLYLRFKGQESTIEINYEHGTDVMSAFREGYTQLYGHWLENKILELTSVKVIAAVEGVPTRKFTFPTEVNSPKPESLQPMVGEEGYVDAGIYSWEKLIPGTQIIGPAIIVSENCTLVLKSCWTLRLDNKLNGHLQSSGQTIGSEIDSASANLTLFTNRFYSVVDEMGAILQRTSFSVNVKERVDFSCALLDKDGMLVVNAPHIPVHLGSMGLCVRAVMKALPMEEGDVIITNHPVFGGSHLPDVTLISPVYFAGTLVAHVANRAHHAEIGGTTPGSMPPDAQTLSEEGVILPPMYLISKGEARWDQVYEKFTGGPYPSRAPEENMADLHGALASIQSGIRGIQRLCSLYGLKNMMHYMGALYHYAAEQMNGVIASLDKKLYQAYEKLDDGNVLAVEIRKQDDTLRLDFSGSAGVHPGNLNATPAIVRSVVLYIMRLLMKENLPLNEGMLHAVKINLPYGLLSPDFENLKELPATVGGNTEISQRLTDTILKALDLAACSYGSMNNIIFGNHSFGFYETIGGGTGAGPGFDGCDGVHQHMTNTRITDPEILEIRYPVRLEEFSIRHDSGGSGKWKGGNGLTRKIRFLTSVTLSVLTQHRLVAPYGKHGGGTGKPGQQWIERNGQTLPLKPVDFFECTAEDLLIMKTPGGGGWGNQETTGKDTLQ